ncbi:MAG: hypothetical protein L3J79_08225 [Candidatus Marinimicrobia bacterium]|nr:hypothetical protein [Candidatus Neomarinimicrobiota bacterium]
MNEFQKSLVAGKRRFYLAYYLENDDDNPWDIQVQRDSVTLSTGLAEVNTIPYAETFESYTNGYEMVGGAAGWSSVHSTNAVVSTNATLISSLNAYSEYCGYPVSSASHAKVLEVDGAVSNLFDMAANQIVWVDQMIQPVLGALPIDTGIHSGVHAGYTFNINGHPSIWHHDLTANSNVWTVLDDITVAKGDWIRLNFQFDYPNDYFQVCFDGVLVTNAQAKTVHDGTGSFGGSWFAMAAGADRLNHLSLKNAVLDDLIVAADNPLVTTNGVPFDWLATYGLTNGTYAEQELLDGDGDDALVWQEWASDTDPTNVNSVLKLTDIEIDDPGMRVYWKGGVQVTQVLERCTNLVSGSWDPIFTNNPPTTISTNFMDSGATNMTGFYRIKADR